MTGTESPIGTSAQTERGAEVDAVAHLSQITPNRVEIMRILRDQGAARPADITAAMDKSSSAVVKSLGRLVDQNWVKTAHPEIDGRKVQGTKLYRLTGLGCHILDTVEQFVETVETGDDNT